MQGLPRRRCLARHDLHSTASSRIAGPAVPARRRLRRPLHRSAFGRSSGWTWTPPSGWSSVRRPFGWRGPGKTPPALSGVGSPPEVHVVFGDSRASPVTPNCCRHRQSRNNPTISRKTTIAARRIRERERESLPGSAISREEYLRDAGRRRAPSPAPPSSSGPSSRLPDHLLQLEPLRLRNLRANEDVREHGAARMEPVGNRERQLACDDRERRGHGEVRQPPGAGCGAKQRNRDRQPGKRGAETKGLQSASTAPFTTAVSNPKRKPPSAAAAAMPVALATAWCGVGSAEAVIGTSSPWRRSDYRNAPAAEDVQCLSRPRPCPAGHSR